MFVVVEQVAERRDFVELYLDGSLAASGSFPINTTGGSTFYMGRIAGPLGDTRRLLGAVDEVTVYDRVLSAAEILAVYSAGSAGKCH
jgi:hypothetical protein